MLKLTVGDEWFDEETNEFVVGNPVELEFEHSLLSLSKWESKFQKPFLSGESKTAEETAYYIEAMIVTPDFPRGVLNQITEEQIGQINSYIESEESATTFGDLPQRNGKGETITSELIYYWMVAFTIPFEPTERWHLNRLFSLVRICHMKNSKPKKLGKAEAARQRAEQNARHRAMLNTSG